MRQSENDRLGRGDAVRAMPVMMDSEEQRPACMPGKMKEDNLLPPIHGRGSQSDTSDTSSCSFRKEKTAPPSSHSSICNSPIKLPNIQRSKSHSVPGSHCEGKVHGHHRHRNERRAMFERSPPLHDYGEAWREQDEDSEGWPDPVVENRPPAARKKNKEKAPPVDSGLRLPEILKDGFLTGSSSRTTVRNSTTPLGQSPRSKQESPVAMKREGTSLNLKIELMKEMTSARNEASSIETQRSTAQSSALLLPLRDGDVRAPTKGKRRRKGKNKNSEASSVYDSEDSMTARDDVRAWRFGLEQFSCSTLAEAGAMDFDEGRHTGFSDDRVIEKMSEENLMNAGHDCASSVERYKRRDHREFAHVKA